MGTGTKAALGVITAGMALLATGVKCTEDGEIISMSAITRITKKKGKGFQTEIMITAFGKGTGLRVRNAEADEIIRVVQAAMRGEYDTPQQS